MRRFHRLSNKTQEYLTKGDSIPEGERHLRLFNAACDMAGNHFTKDQALQKLEPLARASGLPLGEIRKTIHDAFAEDREPARKPGAYAKVYEKVLAFIPTQAWRGNAGMTDRKVMEALAKRCEVAYHDGIFRASQREIAEIARCDRKTVGLSLKRLMARGFIYRVGKDKNSKAFLWKFSQSVLWTGFEALQEKQSSESRGVLSNKIDRTFLPGSAINGYDPSEDEAVSFDSDAREQGALGYTGRLVYETLLKSNKPLSVGEICERTGLSKSQVYRVLSPQKLFVTSGLAQKQPGGWVAKPATREELDQLMHSPLENLEEGNRGRKTMLMSEQYNLENTCSECAVPRSISSIEITILRSSIGISNGAFDSAIH